MISSNPSNKPKSDLIGPKQYRQGWTEFYKLKFKVTEDVLIPRPETELLVDEVLFYAKQKNHLAIFDIGTGSGNIAISLAKNLYHKGAKLKIFATDISEAALKVARENAKLNGVEKNITFLKSSLLQNLNFTKMGRSSRNSIVFVANLPYIPSARIAYLDSSVRDFEPTVALDGGEDGFELYRKLFRQIRKKFFRDFVLIVCEIDYTHGELAVNEALKFFPKAQVEVKTDLAKKQRILKITTERETRPKSQ